jgi:hypothetical protein
VARARIPVAGHASWHARRDSVLSFAIAASVRRAARPPLAQELPPLNREVVNEENPLKVDVFYSMRSPYSCLSLFRYAYLHSAYNLDVTIRVIFPVAARTRHESGHAGSGRWYFYGYSVMDMPRTGLYEGIPFRYANPDPILEDIRTQGEAIVGKHTWERHLTLSTPFYAKESVGVPQTSPKVVADRLGHKDIRMTLNTYGHLFGGFDKGIADALGDAFAVTGATPDRATL